MVEQPQSKESEHQLSLSRALKAGGRLAMVAGSMIPSLSSLAGPTAWMLRAGANVASQFGYSKPMSTQMPNPARNALTNMEHLTDGFDGSLSLGATADTSLAVIKLAGSDFDEMALDYVLSIASWFDTFILSNQVRNTVVWSRDIIPSLFLHNHGEFAGMTTIAWLANMFKYWRGNIKFRFRCARTPYHNARLVVGYIPHNVRKTLPGISAAMDYQSVVWDLSVSPVLDFEVPFISDAAWASTSIHTSLGSIFVTVADILRNPTNVANYVPFSVEVCAGDGFQFAVPIGLRYDTFPSASGSDITHPTGYEEFTVQAGDTVFNSGSGDPSADVIGNSISSLKSLMSKAAVGFDARWSADNAWLMINYPASITLTPGASRNVHASVFKAYAYWRGSHRLHVYSMEPVGTKIITSYPFGLDDTPAAGRGHIWLCSPDVMHVRVPFHSQRSRMSTVLSTDVADYPVGFQTTGKIRWSASWGDDFQLGGFRHAPFIKTIPSTQLTNV